MLHLHSVLRVKNFSIAVRAPLTVKSLAAYGISGRVVRMHKHKTFKYVATIPPATFHAGHFRISDLIEFQIASKRAKCQVRSALPDAM